MRTIAIGTFIAFALAGCGSGKDSDSTTTTGGTAGGTTGGTAGGTTGGTTSLSFVVDWTDDGYTPTDTDSDGFPDTGCDDTVMTTITDPLGAPTWEFGMAETDSTNGWTGEDCFNGYNTFAFCHSVGLTHTLNEVTSCSVLDVVAGSTTLMDAEKDPFLTYYFAEGGDCFVFGNDPSYYATLGCTTL